MTKDEMFLLKAYEASLVSSRPLNRYEIGQKVGISAKTANTICVLLAQANFIKKVDNEHFFVTGNGVALAKQLQEE